MENVLYYGDNLDILRRYVRDESVDLIYLDPPFKSNQNYNVLFKEKDGTQAASQIRAFEDTWTWDQEDEAVFAARVHCGSYSVSSSRSSDGAAWLSCRTCSSTKIAQAVLVARTIASLGRLSTRTVAPLGITISNLQ